MDPLVIVVIVSALFCAVSALLYSNSVAAPHLPAEASRADESSSDLRRVFLVALGLRIGLSLLISLAGLEDFFAPDRVGYEKAGRAIAEWWSGSAAFAPSLDTFRLYHYFNATFFFLVGDAAPVLIRAVNGLVGATAIVITHDIALRVFRDKAVAMRAAWLTAFMPSLVLWSAVNIRDAWAVVAILWTIHAAMRLREQISASKTLSLLLALALLGGIRGYMFLIIAAGVLLSYSSALGGNILRNYVAGGIAATVFIYLYTSLGFGRDLLESASFESLNAQREAFTQSASSSFYEGVDISTPQKALAFLPIGVTYFLFAPFPWSYRNWRQAVTLPEMLFWWYLAIRCLVPGTVFAIRRNRNHALTLISVALVALVAYGLVEGNVGTAYRHRAQVLPVLLILCAAGLRPTRTSTREQST